MIVGGSASPHWKVEAYVCMCVCVCLCLCPAVVGGYVVISLSGLSSMSAL